jgi:hypothetical protein
MTLFPTDDVLVSWGALCPGNDWRSYSGFFDSPREGWGFRGVLHVALRRPETMKITT